MSIKNKTTLKAQIDSEFPDNITGEISPLDLRSQSKDEVDSALNLADTALQTVAGPVNFTFGNLQVDSIPVPASAVIYIRSEADFAVQDTTTITLEAFRLYVLAANVTTAKRFICQEAAVFTAFNILGPTLTYTGAGDMFTGVDVSFSIRDMNITFATAAQGFNFTDSVGGQRLFLCTNLRVNSGTKFGTFNDMQTVQVLNSSCLSLTDGFTFTGVNNIVWSFDKFFMASTSASFVGFDLGSAQSLTLEFDDIIMNAPAGAIGLTGLSNSGNVPTTRLGTFENSEFGGGITPLQNISVSDIRWNFKDNAGLADSRIAADVYLDGGSETITVGAATNWYEIGIPSAPGVSWATDIQERFSVSTAGVITYLGERDITVEINGRATVSKVGGGSDVIEVRLAKNWTGVVSDSGLAKSKAQTQNTNPTSVPIGALVELSQNDNVRAIFSNQSTPADIVASVSALDIIS